MFSTCLLHEARAPTLLSTGAAGAVGTDFFNDAFFAFDLAVEPRAGPAMTRSIIASTENQRIVRMSNR